MLKIQNLACIPVRITPDENVYPIKDVRLIDKKINSLYFFTPSQQDEMRSPDGEQLLEPIGDIDSLNLFLNISDFRNRDIARDFNIKNITVQTLENKFYGWDINSVINTDKCFLNSKSDITIAALLMVYVLYQTESFEKTTDEINGSVSVRIPVSEGGKDYRLSDYVNQTLNGKKIKKIHCTNMNYGGYLTLVSTDRKRKIENMPVSFFYNNLYEKQSVEPKIFEFDPIKIDFENSFLRDRRFGLVSDYELTFIY